eukprot:6242451-Amphidinium_carterae.1
MTKDDVEEAMDRVMPDGACQESYQRQSVLAPLAKIKVDGVWQLCTLPISTLFLLLVVAFVHLWQQ